MADRDVDGISVWSVGGESGIVAAGAAEETWRFVWAFR
jgi:hypothetical protein